MQVSYKKLWKLLIDRDMTRTELRLLSGISSVSLAKLGKDQIVTRNVLAKICTAVLLRVVCRGNCKKFTQ